MFQCRRRWIRLGVLKSKGVNPQQEKEKPPPKKKNPPPLKHKKGEIPTTAPLTTVLRMSQTTPEAGTSNARLASTEVEPLVTVEVEPLVTGAGASKKKAKKAKAAQLTPGQEEAMDLDGRNSVEPTPASTKKPRPKPKPAVKSNKQVTPAASTGTAPMDIEGERVSGSADAGSVE